MKLIATHDSVTGEGSTGILSFLLAPFAKTQNKTLKEQYDCGCRMFDIRVRYKDGKFICAHGLWECAKTAKEILSELDSFEDYKNVVLTYEGNNKFQKEFEDFAYEAERLFPNINFCEVSIKYGKGSSIFKVKYDVIRGNYNGIKCKQGFKPLDGRSWHILLPIPKLWKKIYYDKPEFNDEYFLFVDFL